MKNYNYLKLEKDKQTIQKVKIVNFPEIKPEIKTEKFDDSNLIEAIKANKPEIKTEKFDDSNLIKAIKASKPEIKTEKVKFPEVQKVEVINQTKAPDVQTVHVDKWPDPIKIPDKVEIKNLPRGKGNEEGDPTEFITVRITDGKYYVRPTDKISVGGGGIGSTIGNNVVTGQKLVAVTNTPVALSTSTMIMNGIIVRALSGNSAEVYIGNSSVTSSTGFALSPGESTSLAINNLANVFVTGAAGDGVCYISSQ